VSCNQDQNYTFTETNQILFELTGITAQTKIGGHIRFFSPSLVVRTDIYAAYINNVETPVFFSQDIVNGLKFFLTDDLPESSSDTVRLLFTKNITNLKICVG
jgi:hypothetical protein